MYSAALGARKHVEARWVMTPPALKRLGHISGEIDEAIDPPFAVIDPHCPRLEVHRLPGQGTGLRDTQAAAQHEEKQQAIAHGVNDLEERHEVSIRDGFGQPLGGQQTMLPTADRLLRHHPFVAEVGEHISEDTGPTLIAGPRMGRHQRRGFSGGRFPICLRACCHRSTRCLCPGNVVRLLR